MIRHRPEVDGLRAVAVLPVIFYHADLGPFHGGYVGVDVFFVISGFLITSIIIEALSRECFSFLDFYSRRVRRILPALVLTMLVTLPFAWFLMLPAQFKEFAQSLSSVGVFASNFFFWFKSGYFAGDTATKPLIHTWSLAVEEQYYIAFPVLLMLLWKRERSHITAILGSILVVSLALSQWLAYSHPDANFYLAPTRTWELMLGSLAALRFSRGDVRPNGPLALIGLALIVAAVFAYDANTPFPSLYALVPTVGAALVLLFANEQTMGGRLLSSRAAVGVGLISYSAYLWHQPLFALARIANSGPPSAPVMFGLSLLAIGLAFVSWKWVEQPFRQHRWPAPKVVAVGALTTASLFVVGAALAYSGAQRASFLATLNPSRKMTLRHIEAETSHDIFPADDGQCIFAIAPPASDRTLERFDRCAAQFGPALIVLGDSHAMNLQRALVASGQAPRFMVNVDKGGDCEPFAQPACLSGKTVRLLMQFRREIRAVLYEQAGLYLLRDKSGRATGRLIFEGHEEPVATVDPMLIEAVFRYLDDVRERLGVPVVWVGPWLEPYVPMDRLLTFDCRDAPARMQLNPVFQTIFSSLQDSIAKQSAGHKVTFIRAMDAMAFDSRYDVFDCNHIYWHDGDHFSSMGEERFGKRLAIPIAKALKETSAASGQPQ